MIFQYAHLLKGSIRLVRFHPNSTPASIHLTLEHQERYPEKNVHFTALAYNFQASDGEMQDITLQGRTKLIPRTLWQALSALVEHHDTSGRFWIDYVCVNQRDEVEIKTHKSLLPSIYASADEVLLWLGSADTLAGAERGEVANATDTAFSAPKVSAISQSTVERLQLQHAHKLTLFSGKTLTPARQAEVQSAL